MEVKAKETKNMPKYSKEQFLKSQTIGISADILETLLENEKLYTIDEAKKIAETFKKRKVK